MYINRTAIESLIEAANDAGMEIPEIFNSYYWSSTQCDEFCAWLVNMYHGNTVNRYKYYDDYVRAVSAFQFIY